MTISQIANQFLSFYKAKGAEVLNSAPLVHPLFPMSFNMSAGLVQLDPLLRSQEIQNKKMVVVQKCFRHFDVEKVTDNSHLSFFEMGGYFEVGTLNKDKALEYIFKFLTEILKIDPNKLWVTVFGGDEIYTRNFPEDTDVYEIWEKLIPNKNQIIKFGKSNNFWVQGGGAEIATESKLCGSQSEIFFDLGKTKCTEKQCLPNCKCGRFLEISNNLFITHKITGDLQLLPLTNQAIESVIGLERVVAAFKNKKTVYEIEDIQNVVNELGKTTQATFSMRKNRIVDHLRALCFLIPEGAPNPGRNGRSRIMRTLTRELLTDLYVLDLEPKIYIPRLVEKIIAMYSSRYSEISNKQPQIYKMVFDHEKIYKTTLNNAGAKMLRYLTKKNKIDADEKDQLYFKEQLGIPIELQETYLTYARNS